MDLQPLGRSGLQVSPLTLGGNVFGWTADEALSFRLLDAWVDAGFNFIDTSDVYSRWAAGHVGGESETIIGKWLRQSRKRNRVVLATKVGLAMGNGKSGLAPAHIREAVDASLRRLKTDRIDLYQAHEDDLSTPLEDTLDAFADLIKVGKVLAIGASNYSALRLAQALDIAQRAHLPRYECLQPLYNLYERTAYEEELEPLCVQRGLGVINYFALGSGFLTGKYRSEVDAARSVRGPDAIGKYLNPRGLRILDALDKAAKQYGSTPGQIAIAWQAARPSITAPIASVTSMAQLHELMGAVQLQLDARTIAALGAATAEEKKTV